MQFLRKYFDTSKKDVVGIQPIVQAINEFEPAMESLSDAELSAKTVEFKKRLADGETLDQLLPEAFAAVREVSRRTLGMRQFDVQMVGGVVLHQGRIAEMKTGEGKTLVAVAPMYLNALTGLGTHLVTVNDYLARRDAVWMGPIYHTLGMTIGIIQGHGEDNDERGGSYRYVPGADETGDPRYLNLVPCSRREAYLCDIVYGTNHEYGFDYLRDNMAFSVDVLNQRTLNYAIIDEVDSILIDEARTPHIISGPSMDDVSLYMRVDAVVRNLKNEEHYTFDKKNHSVSMTEEGMDLAEELLDIGNLANEPKLMHHVNAAVKAYALFDKDVEYVVRAGEVILVDENTGRLMFGRRLSDGLHQALEAKEKVPVQRESQTIAVITFQNLFRLYNKLSGMTGTAKTEEDEFRKIYGLDVVTVPTHRPMIRKDQPDIIFKSEEAKFRGIAWEILRLYTKQQPVLVGTRSIEMSERVSSRLEADILQKLVLSARLRHHLEVKKDVPKELKEDAERIVVEPLKEAKKQDYASIFSKMDVDTDALSDASIEFCLEQFKLDEDDREFLDEALRHGIPHNVLNAKFHEREAIIIAEAGRKGGVTIATNMAGRGVDILLGGRVQDDLVVKARDSKGDAHFEQDFASTFASFRRGGKERAAPPLPLSDQERSDRADEVRDRGGMYILGTERHESRRIDNQLRGRAGRQGDPGESRFFVSLEDQLWKIFNAKMLENPMLKAWPELEEVNAKFLSKMIEKTQERIENHFFEARKHVLEYDDVLNAQREHVYGMRRDILLGKHIREDVITYVKDMVTELVRNSWDFDDNGVRVYDYENLYEELNDVFPLLDYAKVSDLEAIPPDERLEDYCTKLAMDEYRRKAERLGDEMMGYLEQQVMLHAVNDKWMDHLQMIDYIREGINLRSYAQQDPLVAYKKETYDLFQTTLRLIRDHAVRTIFRAEIEQQQAGRPADDTPQMVRVEEEPVAVAAGAQPTMKSMTSSSQVDLDSIDWKKVGRNDVCPCGSGKKFKACHYPLLRQAGVL
ncbi:MAG: preprotein translocase subunit SecA [Fimbriimonadaceae bacterium]|nr:preprotein translocase subunit SecA [Fimbriimonadaceae bacterium]